MSAFYVTKEQYRDLDGFVDHIEFLADTRASVIDSATLVSHWVPLKEPLKRFETEFSNRLSMMEMKKDEYYVNSDIDELLQNGLDALASPASEDRPVDDVMTPLEAFYTDFSEKVKLDPKLKRSSLPRELIRWTTDRVKLYASHPSTVKFHFFKNKRPSHDFKAGWVSGKFDAKNSFNLETEHSYEAHWSLNDDEKWSLIYLKIDDEFAYFDKETAEAIGNSLSNPNPEPLPFETSCLLLEEAAKLVAVEIDKAKTWKAESREFVSRKGTSMTACFAEFKDEAGNAITLQKEDGTTMTVQVSQLSDADRDFLYRKRRGAEWIARWENGSREFTSTNGYKIKAILVSSKGRGSERVVKLEKYDGQIVEVTIAKLVEADGDFIDQEFKRRRLERRR